MARTKRGQRSYSAGEWGRNRVRVFPDPKTGLLQIEWRENGRRRSRSLKHRDWARAKRQADEAAAGFAVHEPNGKAEAEPEPLTLGRLFDIYGEEVTPTKGKRTRNRDRVASAMFLDFFGRDRRPETLSQRDWDRFIQARRAGRAGLSGEPVGNRTIAWDLTFLMAVLNWAARSRDEEGNLLLDSNPLRGLRKPREKNPNRVVLTDDEYRAMLNVSRRVGWRFHVAFVLAHYIRDSGVLHALLDVETFHALAGHPVVGASWEGFVIENLLAAAHPLARAGFYRTAAGAEIDLVLEVPGFRRPLAIEIRRGLSPSLGKGFRSAYADLAPERAFVVYAGNERYPVAESVEVIGLPEMARMLANPAALRS